MEEQLINFGTAKLAKEKGFDIEVLTHYSQEDCFGDDYHWFDDDVKNSELEHFEYSAPTQSLLQKWLRVKHNTHIKIDYVIGTYLFTVQKHNKTIDVDSSFKDYITYEEALEVALQEALKLIK